MQFLLVSQQQVTARKTPLALRALKRLLLGVRALVSLQMLQARERPRACCADVRPWLVGFWRGKGRGRGRGCGLRCLHRCCNSSRGQPMQSSWVAATHWCCSPRWPSRRWGCSRCAQASRYLVVRTWWALIWCYHNSDPAQHNDTVKSRSRIHDLAEGAPDVPQTAGASTLSVTAGWS